MNRHDKKSTIRTLSAAELRTVSGGATVCETLSQARARSSGAIEAFFQGALIGAGCTSGSCHGIKRYDGQHS